MRIFSGNIHSDGRACLCKSDNGLAALLQFAAEEDGALDDLVLLSVRFAFAKDDGAALDLMNNMMVNARAAKSSVAAGQSG
jgi:hypothetical protein